MPEVIATISVSAPRRYFGIAVLLCLGGLILTVGLVRGHESLGWQVFLVVTGVLSLWLAEKMRVSTAGRIELTEDALVDATGRVLARIDDIAAVERGTFAIKPSNGFVVRLKTAQARAWAPGLWWRMGRRLGVGGVTAASQTKVMAEILTAMLVERDRGAPAA